MASRPPADISAMESTFALDLCPLEPRYDPFVRQMQGPEQIDSTDSFNRFCQEACRAWREAFPERLGAASPQFSELLDEISGRGPNVIPTGWGGVVITLHEYPRGEKFLVVRQNGYLALEEHEQKDENLEVREGIGLILWRQKDNAPLVLDVLTPGRRFHLPPGREHCLIGTENLLVFERSTDPKGMDQDLIFIYEPEAA